MPRARGETHSKPGSKNSKLAAARDKRAAEAATAAALAAAEAMADLASPHAQQQTTRFEWRLKPLLDTLGPLGHGSCHAPNLPG